MNKIIGVIKSDFAHLSFFLLFAVIFLAGTGFGSGIAAKSGAEETAAFKANMEFSVEALKDADGETKSSRVLRSAMYVTVTVLSLWACGFVPKLPCFALCMGVLLFKGTAIGYTLGMIFRVMGNHRLGFALACILPQYLLLIPLMIGAATFAVCGLRDTPKRAKGQLVAAIILVGAGFLCSLMDSLVTGSLIKQFF